MKKSTEPVQEKQIDFTGKNIHGDVQILIAVVRFINGQPQNFAIFGDKRSNTIFQAILICTEHRIKIDSDKGGAFI